VLVISQDVFNERSGTVIAVALTSQPQKAGFPLTFELSHPQLQKKSWVKLFLDSCGVTKWLKAASILDRYLKNAKKVVPQNIHLFLDL